MRRGKFKERNSGIARTVFEKKKREGSDGWIRGKELLIIKKGCGRLSAGLQRR